MNVKPLSETLKFVIYKLMKNSSFLDEGFICYGRRIVFKTSFDEEACEQLLKQMMINKDTVLKYLEHKYVPTYVENGAFFRKQKCIQKVLIREDGEVFIFIRNSEPHKIITDTMHVMKILSDHGFVFTNNMTFIISNLKVNYYDLLLYNVLVKEFGYSLPYSAKFQEKRLRFHFKKLEDIARIKKVSIKKKFLRYMKKVNMLDNSIARQLIDIDNFRKPNIYSICKDVRENMKLKGFVLKGFR